VFENFEKYTGATEGNGHAGALYPEYLDAVVGGVAGHISQGNDFNIVTVL